LHPSSKIWTAKSEVNRKNRISDMNWLFVTLTVFIVIASVLLVIVVLLQNGKDGGFVSNFVAGNQTFGVRQTTDMLEKVTWGLVTFILVVSIVTAFTVGSKGSQIDVTDQVEQSAQQPEFPSAAPVQEAPSTEAPATEAPSTEAPASEAPAE
jgi:preprotein translocase subunit SecG